MRRMSAGLAAVLIPMATARAGITFATDGTHYVVAPNATVEVRVYLEFSELDAVSLVDEDGLFGTGVTLTVTESVPSNNPAIIAQATDILPNSGEFDDPFGAITDFGLGFASMLVTVDPYSGDGDLGAVGEVIGSVRRIELGVFRFTAGAVPGELTTMVVGDFDPSTDDTVTWSSFQVLDGMIGTATITIQTEGEFCPADFTLDGFVDTDDFTAFVLAFILGGDDADFDKSGFVDTDDFTAFTLAFEAGC
ncbi:MAG: hypothetical protein GIKADHBN_00142 [Phycisphaerales bacterium]|nr:hypothetical protein [Phycisphaerales bacterium]